MDNQALTEMFVDLSATRHRADACEGLRMSTDAVVKESRQGRLRLPFCVGTQQASR